MNDSLKERAEQHNSEQEQKALVVRDETQFRDFMDTARFKQIQKIGNIYASSKLVPTHFQKDIASTTVIVQMAMRLELDPLMVLQNTYMVHGRPGMEGKLIIALINARGPFTGPVQWRFEDGNGQSNTNYFQGCTQCVAYATHKVTKEICSAVVTWEMVKAEGWLDKPGSKWKTMPDVMFRYRSATFLARFYCPEVLMGMSTKDELVDISGEEIIEGEWEPVVDNNLDVPKDWPAREKPKQEATPEAKEQPKKRGRPKKEEVKEEPKKQPKLISREQIEWLTEEIDQAMANGVEGMLEGVKFVLGEKYTNLEDVTVEEFERVKKLFDKQMTIE